MPGKNDLNNSAPNAQTEEVNIPQEEINEVKAYENKEKAAHLALIGAIREDILPNEQLGEFLLEFLKSHYPNSLENRYDIKQISDRLTVLNQIAERRKLVNSNGANDIERAGALLLKEFKDGLLGNITLEWYES